METGGNACVFGDGTATGRFQENANTVKESCGRRTTVWELDFGRRGEFDVFNQRVEKRRGRLNNPLAAWFGEQAGIFYERWKIQPAEYGRRPLAADIQHRNLRHVRLHLDGKYGHANDRNQTNGGHDKQYDGDYFHFTNWEFGNSSSRVRSFDRCLPLSNPKID